MAMNWLDVKNEIEDEIDKIFWDKPIEFQLAEKNIFPSGAGTDNCALGNRFFMISDTSNIGRHVVEPAMYAAFDDDEISLDVMKKFWVYLTGGTTEVLGSMLEPNCKAPWLNLPKIREFYLDMVDALDSIHTKEEFKEMYYSWANYLTVLNRWAMVTYPWEYGWYQTKRTTEIPGELKEKYPY